MTVLTPSEPMGKVTATITVTNWVDEVLAERGFIDTKEVRSIILKNVLVDTGATRLCLPAEIVQQLGLKRVGAIDVKTAIGPKTVNVYEGIKLSVEGREGRYDCVELPTEEAALLGLIPLEDLGLEPDLQNQQLRHLPTQGKDTYLTVL